MRFEFLDKRDFLGHVETSGISGRQQRAIITQNHQFEVVTCFARRRQMLSYYYMGYSGKENYSGITACFRDEKSLA